MNLQHFFLLQQQASGAPAQGKSMWLSLVMLVLLVFIFWLFFMRPQSKKQKEIQRQRDALAAGDKILTAGGIRGTIREISDTYFLIEVDKNIHIRVEKSSVYPANY